MNKPGFVPLQPHPQVSVQEQEKMLRRQPWYWWYRLSSPDENSTVLQSDILPRSQLASILILATLVVSIAFIPAALTSDSLHVLPPVIGMFVIGCICIPLNRSGNVTLVGVLIVGALDIALVYSLLSYPNFTLTQNAIPIYDLFVLSDVIAISLLPAKSILFVSFYHSIFMLADIVLQPHTPDLQALLNSTGYSLMVRPLTIQIVVALLMYLWVRNALKALERANKAEVIARLEHTIILERHELDEGIKQILATLVQAANGNTNVRAPLAQQHVLWQVGIGLNTLLARLQRSGQSEHELQRLKQEIQRLQACVQEAKGRRIRFWSSPGGSELDPVISELMGSFLTQSPPGPPR